MLMKDWRDRLRDLNINPDRAYQNVQAALERPDLEREIGEVRKEVARERPLVRAELGELNFSPSGLFVLRMRFDPDEVEGSTVSSLRLNDVPVHLDAQASQKSSTTPDGRPQVEWMIKGHTADPEEARRLQRSTSYSLEGSLGGNRRFTAFGTKSAELTPSRFAVSQRS
jgi:hypothetical protein